RALYSGIESSGPGLAAMYPSGPIVRPPDSAFLIDTPFHTPQCHRYIRRSGNTDPWPDTILFFLNSQLPYRRRFDTARRSGSSLEPPIRQRNTPARSNAPGEHVLAIRLHFRVRPAQ